MLLFTQELHGYRIGPGLVSMLPADSKIHEIITRGAGASRNLSDKWVSLPPMTS